MDTDFAAEIRRIDLEIIRLGKTKQHYQALIDLATNSASASVTKRKKSNFNWEITKKQLEFMYHKQHLSAAEIAKEASVSTWTVFNRMKKFKISRKNKKIKTTS